MKDGVRHILRLSTAAAVLICMAVTYGMGVKRSRETRCTGLNVVIADSSVNRFVSKQDISGLLKKEYGDCTGSLLDTVNLSRIEKITERRSAVYRSEAYTTADGKLNLRITQRRPAVRFQKGATGFYADEEAYLFPLQKSFAADVPIVEGALPINVSDGFKGRVSEPSQDKWVTQVIALVSCFNGDRTWKGCITQIHVNGQQELEIVTRRGNEVFLFGQPTCVKEKMQRMETYYRTVKPKSEQGYKVVDLRFDGKIIGRQQ